MLRSVEAARCALSMLRMATRLPCMLSPLPALPPVSSSSAFVRTLVSIMAALRCGSRRPGEACLLSSWRPLLA